MIGSWRVGDARVTHLTEYAGPVHIPDQLYPDMDRSVLEEHRALLEGPYWSRISDRLVIGVQIWILHVDDRIILVDTGYGNAKPRNTPRANRLNTVVPDWLSAADAGMDRITDVVMTHLHSDHIGWNTVLDGETWVPTFPNATYHIPQGDYAWFKDFAESGKAKDGAFHDSVAPVVEAGQARFVTPGDTVAGVLEAVAAYGHTPGHLNFWLRRGSDTAVFCGDNLHHPVQIYRPEWRSRVDILPDIAPGNRLNFLNMAASENALILPCHFGGPHCGFVRRNGDGFEFVPAPEGSMIPTAPISPWRTA